MAKLHTSEEKEYYICQITGQSLITRGPIPTIIYGVHHGECTRYDVVGNIAFMRTTDAGIIDASPTLTASSSLAQAQGVTSPPHLSEQPKIMDGSTTEEPSVALCQIREGLSHCKAGPPQYSGPDQIHVRVLLHQLGPRSDLARAASYMSNMARSDSNPLYMT